MKKIAVIPAFNEGTMIRDVVSRVLPHVQEVVVVDDGSSDDTYEQAKQTDATVIRHIINRGQGAALQTGMELALKKGADIILHFDSDGQHPAHQIQDLVKPVIDGDADIVMGSRFLDQSSNVPKMRRIILRGGAIFTRIMTGLAITDPHSGFRAMNAKAAKQIRLRQDRMAHASELLQLVARNKLRHKEVPVTITYTDYSMAKGQSSWNAIKIVVDLIKGSLL
jgi:glycosyltransferase involved in cell wall biosynthesis